jgi:hypothetical protein
MGFVENIINIILYILKYIALLDIDISDHDLIQLQDD